MVLVSNCATAIPKKLHVYQQERSFQQQEHEKISWKSYISACNLDYNRLSKKNSCELQMHNIQMVSNVGTMGLAFIHLVKVANLKKALIFSIDSNWCQ